MPFRHARHTRAVWQYRHAMALSGPLATRPGTSRNRLPPASPPRCDGTEAKVSHLHSINKRLTAHRRCDARQNLVTSFGCDPTIGLRHDALGVAPHQLPLLLPPPPSP